MEHYFAKMLSPSDVYCLTKPSAPGWACVRGVIANDTDVNAIASHARARTLEMMQAGVGRGAAHRIDKGHRGDMHCWLTEEYLRWCRQQLTPVGDDPVPATSDRAETVPSALAAVFEVFRRISIELVAVPGVSLHLENISLQLSLFEGRGEAGYVCHRDALAPARPLDTGRGQPHRVWTCILYANGAEWDMVRDGGALRVYTHPDGWAAGKLSPPPGSDTIAPPHPAYDVCPRGGTLVVFRSTAVDHEVMQARRDRAAYTLWLYGWEDEDSRAASPVNIPVPPPRPTRPLPVQAQHLLDAFLGTRAGRGVGKAALSPSHASRPLETISDAPAAPTIFVLIPAFRDPEVVNTALDCVATASVPGRITLGIVWQYELAAPTGVAGAGVPSARDAALFAGWPSSALAELGPARVRHAVIDARAAGGPAWARFVGTGLYAGQDWVLSLDAHTRFVPGWDNILIHQTTVASRHASAGAPYPPAVILSTYPRGYTLDGEGRAHVPGRPALRAGSNRYEVVTGEEAAHMVRDVVPQQGHGSEALCPLQPTLPSHLLPIVLVSSSPPAGPISPKDGLLRITGKTVYSLPTQLVKEWEESCSHIGDLMADAATVALSRYPAIPGAFIAAGFLFCPGRLWATRLMPSMARLRGAFFGEEAVLAAVAAEASVRVYAPGCNVVFHLWTRERAGQEALSWRQASSLQTDVKRGPNPQRQTEQAAWAQEESSSSVQELLTILRDKAGPASALAALTGLDLYGALAQHRGSAGSAVRVPLDGKRHATLKWELPPSCFQATDVAPDNFAP